MTNIISINRLNLLHNFAQIKKKAGKKKVIAVLKANAYGHGIEQIAETLKDEVDIFQVDDIEELRKIRKITNKRVLVLGYVMQKDLDELVNLNGIPAVWDISQLHALNNIGKNLNKKIKVHLAIDTGMGREGILVNDLKEFLEASKDLKNIEFEGIYSHFCDANDSEDQEYSIQQIKKFNYAASILESFGYKNIEMHIESSGSYLRFNNQIESNYVRAGIILYGIWPSKFLQNQYSKSFAIKPVLSWKSVVAGIKVLPSQSYIGYNRTFKTTSQTKIALIPTGYSHGVSRNLSNVGEVLINGQKCRILGKVSMNMMTVDVTELNQINFEDEVVFIGTQEDSSISVEFIAEKSGQINYEVVSNISNLLYRQID